MLHPLVKLLASRPDLLADHLAGYGELLAVQATELSAALRLRALLAVVAGVATLLGVALGGVALLLVAALPMANMPAPWVLLAVPLMPLAMAVGCWAVLQRRPFTWSLDVVREQLAADASLLREAGQP